ncbi:MAG TPA: PAS domain S-box protein, partial [Thermoanaerobaculia bacterium]
MIHLLLVDDSTDDAELLVLELRKAGLEFEERILTSLGELSDDLDFPYSAVISDYNLGSHNGIDVLRRVRELRGDVPVIIVSGTIGEESAAQIIVEGADDYVSKDRLARLPRALSRALQAAASRGERRNLEQSLRQAEARYRRTFEQAPVGILNGDRDGRCIAVNERFCAMLDRTAEEILGHGFDEFCHPDERASFRENYAAMFSDSTSYARYERRYLRKDGSTVWTTVTVSPVTDEHGAIEYLLAHVEDISSVKRSREKLNLQARLLDCVQQAVIATDLSGTVTYWNAFAALLYGWSESEAIGRHVGELTVPLESQSSAAMIMEQILNGRSWQGEFEVMRRDGSRFPALIVDSPLFGEDGTVIGVVGVSLDISQQKNVEAELREHKMQLAEAQELAHAGSWTYDLTTGEREYSPGLYRLLGAEALSPLDPEKIFQDVHPDDRDGLRALWEHAHASRESGSAEFRIRLADGERTLICRYRTLTDESGDPRKVLAMLLDVTDAKRIEQELRQHTIQQAAVANLGQMALSGASETFLLQQAAHLVRTTLDGDLAEIVQWRANSFRQLACSGGETFASSTLEREECNLAAYVVEHAEPVIVENLAREERFTPPPQLLAERCTSSLALPIIGTEERPWGVLALHTRQSRVFSPHELDFLRSISTVLAQAIDRAGADTTLRLRATQQSAIAQLGRLILSSVESDVFDRACALITHVTGACFAFIEERTADEQLLLRAGKRGGDDGSDRRQIRESDPAGAALLTGEPVIVNDYRTQPRYDRSGLDSNVLSGVAIPIGSGSLTFGVLSAHSTTAERFGLEDLDFLQALANMLAEAMNREHARIALEQSELRYRQIFQGASEVIFSIDPQGRFITLNRAFETTTGLSIEQWIGRDFTELVDTDDRLPTLATFREMIAGESPDSLEIVILGRDKKILMEVSSFPQSENGIVTEVYGFARDITEERRAEQERESLTRDLQLLLEST